MTNIEILESVNIKHKELKEDKPLLLLNILKAMDLARTEQSILCEVIGRSEQLVCDENDKKTICNNPLSHECCNKHHKRI